MYCQNVVLPKVQTPTEWLDSGEIIEETSTRLAKKVR